VTKELEALMSGFHLTDEGGPGKPDVETVGSLRPYSLLCLDFS